MIWLPIWVVAAVETAGVCALVVLFRRDRAARLREDARVIAGVEAIRNQPPYVAPSPLLRLSHRSDDTK